MSENKTPGRFRGGVNRWPRILLWSILGFPLLTGVCGCSKFARNQINASFKSGGTVLQIENTGNWDWPHLFVKLNRYAPEGPFTLAINEPLAAGESINVELANFRNAGGSRFNPVETKVEIISLRIAAEDRTFRFN